MRQTMMKRCGKALVLGGSTAGLLAARVLSDYFAEVTIIERDRYPAEPVPRGRAVGYASPDQHERTQSNLA